MTKRYNDSKSEQGGVRLWFFNDTLSKRSFGLRVNVNSIRLGFEQSTNFRSINCKAKQFAGIVLKKDVVHLESKTVLKWVLPNLNNVSFYLGLKNSMDGSSILAGLKVAGVKLLFPIIALNPVNLTTNSQDDSSLTDWMEIFIYH